MINIEFDRQKNVLKCAGIIVDDYDTKDIKYNYKKSIIEKVITLDGKLTDVSFNDLLISENKSTGQLNYFYNDKEYLPIFEFWNKNVFTYYIIPLLSL